MDEATRSEDSRPAVASWPDSELTAGDFALRPSASSRAIFQAGALVAGRYDIIELLGEGGMGAVYKAHDRELDRVVALKFIRPELASNAEILRRFKQEIILARGISHRNVVRIYDLGESTEGTKFVSMEFVEGESLAVVLKRRGKFPPADAAAIMHQVFGGLAAAHACHVVHRDLKPANIMRDLQGRIVIMDFGLARHESADGMTRTGAVLGTVDYMSPEQAQGKPVDARCDLFTAGMILYELLTGLRPYQADSTIASLLKRTYERPQPASSFDPSIPSAISEICSKCLEINPEDRYQSATELLAELDAWMTGSKFSSSRRALSRTVRAVARRRMPWRATAISAVVVAVAAVAGILSLHPRPASTAAHGPISVLVADFTNHTGDPVFDGTLEPMFNVALEGASFINAFSRGEARKLAGKLPHPTDKLDEQASRLVALSQGISAVVTGSLSRRGDGYKISVKALDSKSGNSIASAEVMAGSKEDVLRDLPKLAAPIRKALGDTTPESVQFNTMSGEFTAASLEAVHQDAIGVEQQFAGKFEEALQSFSKAAELDPNFPRAYSGMAASASHLDRRGDAEKYIKLAMAHEDRMTERERYRNRGLFYMTTGNWQKCIEENTQLISRYPADRIGQNNLASCLGGLRQLPEAVEAARRAAEIVPKGALYRLNLSFFSSASGDFRAGEQEARTALQLNPSSEVGYLILAEAQLGQGQLAQAAESYRQLEKLSALGASLAATGLADLALYEGRFEEAARTLEKGATGDLATKNLDAAANKFAALAYTYLSRQQTQPAIRAAEKALANSQGVSIRFLAARIFAETGEVAKAKKLAAGLGSELQAEPQAYAKIIEGKVALRRGDAHGAIKALTEANNLLDTWIGRLELGRAYLQAGAFVEADSEFDRCLKRQGEALELFMDDVPTYGYFPTVYYYQGRVREGMKSPEFLASYRTYLEIRGKAGEDPLLADIHRRAGQ
jgi:tetratricopeptide (TPR) repeat protein